MHDLTIHPIAYIENGFNEKFGIPRQSCLTKNQSLIRFVPEYRDINAVRGLEDFDYLWLIWCFSENLEKSNQTFHATVRPPRLGGNTHMGVFATRSSFRPNGLALSSVHLVNIDLTSEDAPLLIVEGADLMDGTPIYDIKPYLAFADSHPDAKGGFTDEYSDGSYLLEVQIGSEIDSVYKENRKLISELTSILKEDPRPSYQDDPTRIYGMHYAGYNVKFTVCDKILTIQSIEPM